MTRILTLLVWSVAWLQSLPVHAQEPMVVEPEQVGVSTQKLEAIPAAVLHMIEEQSIAGAVVLVAREGRVVFLDAQGLRDVESGSPMQPDTLFRIYSMTKPVTSVAVLMLMEQGRLELDDSIGQHLPELKDLEVYKNARRRVPTQRPVTIRDLLRHTSGMTYGFFSKHRVDKLYMKDHPLFSASHSELVEKLAPLPLVYQPGTVWHYSIATDVLGVLVERLSGQPLDEFLQVHLFDPLSMADTAFHVPDDKLDRFASTYGPELSLVDGYQTSDFRRAARLQSGGGGLVSTAFDYLNFCQMLLDGGVFEGHRLLREETVGEMTRNQLPDGVWSHGGNGFGLGVLVQMHDWGTRAHRGQFGWDGMASTHFWISPEDDLVFIALSQRQPFSNRLKATLTPIVYEALEP